jgi:hypothetical protein
MTLDFAIRIADLEVEMIVQLERHYLMNLEFPTSLQFSVHFWDT